ncbi:MAG: hypothetical protein HFF08_07165 [Oscillospiraceae bacterium]|nr:hypothetical protein [Oscillospiraceae bacterium]
METRNNKQLTKARDQPHSLTVIKSDGDRRLVFGWANVAVRVDGEQIVDWQEDIIDIAELEKAAYGYMAEFGTAGEMHRRGGVGRVIESIVFTKEKAAALGIPPDILPEGWWIGFQITDEAVWEKIKNGEYSMFSIEGTAVREPVEGGDTGWQPS